MVLAVGCSAITSAPVAICGTAEFDSLPAVLEPLETLDENDRVAVVEALIDDGDFEGRNWQVVSDGNDLVLFGSPTDSNFPYGHAKFNRTDGQLVLEIATNCNLFFDSPGQNIASFRLDPDKTLEPTSTKVPILFTEKACAGGGALNGRTVRPSVIETDDRIEIVVFIDALDGPQPCPSNAEVAWEIELDTALGERTIADASEIPARELPAAD